ncbi:MAG: 4Fe-4S dicluster domain-containing protein [Desulfurivibrio sp.]|nr:MAG: 4Fe-4S dicluster domain-containing protein [Desulfurivibrio sp.]
MQDANTLKEYRQQCQQALDDEFLRQAMDSFATAYRANRVKAFAGMNEKELIAEIAAAKDAAISRLPELYEEFRHKAEQAGVHVHLAGTAAEANEIICRIAKEHGCRRIVKSKSMTAEETLLNHRLEADGLTVTETDLGEWIIQLRHEGPSHMVMPAIHLSRYQVAELFTDVTRKQQDSDIEKLVKVARRELRGKYIEADMGISGANFAVVETGSIGIVTNEGNARLVTTLPRVHVALCGVDKLTPTLHDALRIIKALPRNATGQAITSYVTWITGANACATGPEGKKEYHIVFLDNGRLALARDPDCRQILRCVRCGACANVCPVYRLVGGHRMGHIYIGAIGLLLTYFFHGRDKARNLIQNCINCGACREVCAAGIDLPGLIKKVHARIQNEEGHPLPSVLLAKVMSNRKLFHTLLKTARWGQKPVKEGTTGYLRHLPMIFGREQNFRALPAVADQAFRDEWPMIRPQVDKPRLRVALFSGCVQDFVYPEQMKAGVKVMSGHGVAMEYPMGQSCCGLPLVMMGESRAARDVAEQNVKAMDPARCDYIVTLCASCASHLKHAYPKMLADDPQLTEAAGNFAAKVIDFSSFVSEVLGVDKNDFRPQPGQTGTAYHSPCHLCRGLGVTEAPRRLLREAGLNYVPSAEEDVCCGFGGTFSMKFPEESRELLKKKLDNVAASGAGELVTDCPGCVMQLRGGAEVRGDGLRVRHIAEALAERKK